MKAINLKVDGLTKPFGIDILNPRFTWNCEEGRRQMAYQVVVAGENGDVLCDSGIVHTDEMAYRYEGTPLRSRQRASFKVCLWDEAEEAAWSRESYFEMGLISKSDWRAKWIAGVDTDHMERLPVDCFCKTFKINRKVAHARLYATAHGVYFARINGKRLPGVLAPGCSEYTKTLYYQTYDVSDLLQEENCLELWLGEGWYKGKVGSDNTEYLYGTQTALLAQLEITFEDGSRQVIGTDESFLWSNDGPIRAADLKDGEIYDARMKPSYNRNAVVISCEEIPKASNAPMILEHETFQPTLEVSPSGQRILNFGQNLSGYIRFRVHGEAGQKMVLHMFEAKDHGEYSSNTITGRCENLQRIEYICNGDESEFSPEFFYSGFQYAWVEGVDNLCPEDFTAVAVYSDIPFNSTFICSNEAINQFVKNTVWSEKGNFVDIPTDCPQREKSGWTGDAQIFTRTACYFSEPAAFYRKWLKDVRDCQRENGMVVDVNPRIRGKSERDAVNGSSGWADAAIIIPYTLWKLYDDETFITDNLKLMLGWRNYVISLCQDKSMFELPNGHPLKAIYEGKQMPESEWSKYVPEAGVHWGEWCEPDFRKEMDENPEFTLLKPKQEVTTAYLHYSMGLLEEMLVAVGENEEAMVCREYTLGAKNAYNYYFVNEKLFNTEHMAELVRPLALGLVDDKEMAEKIAKALNDMAIRKDYKVGTGFLSTAFLLPTLVKYGYVDTAYRMLENKKVPGWLAMVEKGATTVWENYEGYDNEERPKNISFNHYSMGSVCSFLYDTVCGIKVAGRNHVNIRSVPGGTLQYAAASYASPYGVIESSWKKEGENIRYIFKIPANMTADITVAGETHQVTSGTYEYVG